MGKLSLIFYIVVIISNCCFSKEFNNLKKFQRNEFIDIKNNITNPGPLTTDKLFENEGTCSTSLFVVCKSPQIMSLLFYIFIPTVVMIIFVKFMFDIYDSQFFKDSSQA